MNQVRVSGAANGTGRRAVRLFALFLACTALLAAGCRPAPASDGPAPKSLAAADPIIVRTAPMAKGVLVTARVDQPDLAGDSIRLASRAVRQIARAVQAGAGDLPPNASMITFELYGVDVDKFGKRTPARLFAADYDIEDLKGADLKTMGPAKTLNLASDLRIDHAGIAPINAWCMRYPHVGTNYCEMAGFGG
jgi:hypothetical protein